jgi:tRNA threonylcarbamoyl adenosine modification protein (Sua5/YciO/YrdC/YwlC family)
VAQYFKIHPANPQTRLIRQAVDIVRSGGVIVYPTDSGYALGCAIGLRDALERICRIRRLDEKHHFTLVCRDLKDVSSYAMFDTPVYRLLKAHTPGSYTFILRATKEVPKRLMHPKQKTIGLRIPDHPIVQAMLGELGESMLSTTLIFPGETEPMTQAEDIRKRLENQVDLVIDGGTGGTILTTMVDLVEDVPKILRIGKGDPKPFE